MATIPFANAHINAESKPMFTRALFMVCRNRCASSDHDSSVLRTRKDKLRGGLPAAVRGGHDAHGSMIRVTSGIYGSGRTKISRGKFDPSKKLGTPLLAALCTRTDIRPARAWCLCGAPSLTWVLWYVLESVGRFPAFVRPARHARAHRTYICPLRRASEIRTSRRSLPPTPPLTAALNPQLAERPRARAHPRQRRGCVFRSNLYPSHDSVLRQRIRHRVGVAISRLDWKR